MGLKTSIFIYLENTALAFLRTKEDVPKRALSGRIHLQQKQRLFMEFLCQAIFLSGKVSLLVSQTSMAETLTSVKVYHYEEIKLNSAEAFLLLMRLV